MPVKTPSARPSPAAAELQPRRDPELQILLEELRGLGRLLPGLQSLAG